MAIDSIIHTGDTPKNPISIAAIIGIQTFLMFTPAVLYMWTIGDAIRATTAGLNPLNTFSTIGLFVKSVKTIAIKSIMTNDGIAIPSTAIIAPQKPFILYPINKEEFIEIGPGSV